MLEDYDRAKRYYGQAIRLNRNYEPAQQNMRRIYELFQFGSSRGLSTSETTNAFSKQPAQRQTPSAKHTCHA